MNRVSAENLGEGLYKLRRLLLESGYSIQTASWQGTKEPPTFLEILHADLVAKMSDDPKDASKICQATQPWADTHFEERVGGQPLNPPPSHVMWLKDTDNYLSGQAFSHSYPERMWAPKVPGIRFQTGNLGDAVELLKKDRTTRQCYVPMWFPEDIIAANQGERVPCSFGWHFLVRNNELHCSYHMRACDVVRHLHNDLYFANRLCLWLNKQADLHCEMGYLHFSSTSLHCFLDDKYMLNNMIKQYQGGQAPREQKNNDEEIARRYVQYMAGGNI